MRFIDVVVEEHDELPEGCFQRFKALEAPRPVHHVRYEGATWAVSSPGAEPMAAPVEDSGAGTSWLIYGGERGLRLTREGAAPLAEPYLLLGATAILD